MTREEAIRDIEECVLPYVGGISLRMAIEALKEQRPHGEWVLDKEISFVFNIYECSKCRFNGSKRWNFCPNCGAKMKEGDEK